VYVTDEICDTQKIITKTTADEVLYYFPVDYVIEAAVLSVVMVVTTDLGKNR
jgi:hypothetical protein